jgi:hypothetical protein
LYHYTEIVDQTIEGTSTIDPGYHRVGLDYNGRSFDYDGDGYPNWMEDANGNGAIDNGETSWQNAQDLGLWVRITSPGR